MEIGEIGFDVVKAIDDFNWLILTTDKEVKGEQLDR